MKDWGAILKIMSAQNHEYELKHPCILELFTSVKYSLLDTLNLGHTTDRQVLKSTDLYKT